ncbi:MAG: acetylornithine and succinylornithine aminotransferase [Thermomicrobiales bacterium]|jgi:acetylornithine/LysW-gamma-L-lysine aminotransferase|nr:acetylornithine and succinylornithine aminotransferase [Thermomicrobiales bacterium]MDF2757902.1 acetylornithine and succinylornithine aminotransferase [Thermomicrobiales bacterium]MDF3016046.1 acetylornithine and succinylornithine aminotransferase [Thermomicrobiales bacterium]
MTVGTLDLSQIQQLENEHQPPLYAKREIALVRGDGPYLFDWDGRRYLDAMSNYGVAVLGHADPEYAAALGDQLHTLATGHQSFYSDVRAELLHEITAIAPAGLTRYFLSNSGAEAIEAAIKFARVATGRPNLVAAKRGYHGRTLGALAATADQKYRAPFEPLAPTTTHVSFNDVAALETAVDDQTAAILLEPIQGEGGIWPAAPEYLQSARDIAAASGTLLIADEIQTGFRTGTPWAIDASGVVPDILVTAKALANGFPIGLTICTEAVSSEIPSGAHGTTFGASPLACRAALVTLHALRERDLYSRSTTLGTDLMNRLTSMDSPKVRQVRGRGMMIGVELKERVTPTLRALQERGVLVLPAGPTTFRLLPPLIWEQPQVDEFIAAAESVLC